MAAKILSDGGKLTANKATDEEIEKEMREDLEYTNERIHEVQEHEKKTDVTRLHFLISRIFSGELSQDELEAAIVEANQICSKYGLQPIRLSNFVR